MKLLNQVLSDTRKIYDYFNYRGELGYYSFKDARDFTWSITKQNVYVRIYRIPGHYGDEQFIYQNGIYRGPEYTMIVTKDLSPYGIQFLILDNTKEVL